MNYSIVDYVNGDIYTKNFRSKDEALANAQLQWESMSKYDQGRRLSFDIVESSDESIESIFNGNLIKSFI